MASSPLMYEVDQLNFGGKIAVRNLLVSDNYNNSLDLDPQECSFDIQQLLLNAALEAEPRPPITVSSEPANPQPPSGGPPIYTTPHSDEVLSVGTQMPSAPLFLQQEEPDIPRNFDLASESSVDIQALLTYTGASSIKDEKPIELPTCSFQSFQAELELPSSVQSIDQAPSSPETSPAQRPSRKGKSKKRFPDKGSEEYVEKRARNNVAVRKSRTKAKQRQVETESRVKLLTDENDRLQKKVDLLSKELNVLKSLFLNVGAALPADFESVLQK